MNEELLSSLMFLNLGGTAATQPLALFPTPPPNSEIELSDDLPVPEYRNRKRRPCWHIPIIQRNPSHQLVTARPKVIVLGQILNIVPQLGSAEVDSAQSRNPATLKARRPQHR